MTIIPLRLTRYNDRHSILLAYSREAGPVSLLVPAGSGKRAAVTRSLLMPLSVVDCQADIRPGRDIHRLSGVRPLEVLNNVMLHPGRRMTAQFLAEVLSVVLREGQPDEALFHFLHSSIRLLNDLSWESAVNFNLAFLYALARVVGIAPDTSTWREGSVFDMVDGVFRQAPPVTHRQWLSADDSRVLWRLSRMTYDNMNLFRFSRDERNRTLDMILDYYSIHYTSLRSLQSLAVLRSLV